MSSGFTSNYIDSGYTLPTNITWYDASNNPVTTVSSKDIYFTSQQVGVYMINVTSSGFATVYPFFCSSSMSNLSIPADSDDAWIVYPGYGFILYSGGGFDQTSSRYYVNTSGTPQSFYMSTNGQWNTKGTQILQGNGSAYSANITASARIYFRGVEIKINGISPAN